MTRIAFPNRAIECESALTDMRECLAHHHHIDDDFITQEDTMPEKLDGEDIYEIQDALRSEGDRVSVDRIILAINRVLNGEYLPTSTDLAVEHHMKKMGLLPTEETQ